MNLASAIFMLAIGFFARRRPRRRIQAQPSTRSSRKRREYSDDNPLMPEKIALGKQFFWDKRWSRNGTIACVTCHDPNHGSGDRRQFSARFDGKPTARHSPTLINRLFSDAQQWTGQRASLEDQAIK